jgi:hypothetical protein
MVSSQAMEIRNRYQIRHIFITVHIKYKQSRPSYTSKFHIFYHAEKKRRSGSSLPWRCHLPRPCSGDLLPFLRLMPATIGGDTAPLPTATGASSGWNKQQTGRNPILCSSVGRAARRGGIRVAPHSPVAGSPEAGGSPAVALVLPLRHRRSPPRPRCARAHPPWRWRRPVEN